MVLKKLSKSNCLLYDALRIFGPALQNLKQLIIKQTIAFREFLQHHKTSGREVGRKLDKNFFLAFQFHTFDLRTSIKAL
jgi:hypothetical protein